MQFGKIAKTVVGTLGLVATVFAIIQGFREYRPATPKLHAAVVNVEHVSSRTEIPDVKISLAFKETTVPDLWLCRVRFQNVGGTTLYTTGPKPNTQNPIVISVPENYQILQIEPKGIDPKDSGFEAQVRQKKDDKGLPDKHLLEVAFEQWRKGEAIEAVLYLSGSGDRLDRPRLIPKGRPILDGDVVPIDLSSVAAPEVRERSIIDGFIGPKWGGILRIFSFLTLAVAIFVFALKSAAGRIIWGETGFRKRCRDWYQNHPNFRELLELVLVLAMYIAMLEFMNAMIRM